MINICGNSSTPANMPDMGISYFSNSLYLFSLVMSLQELPTQMLMIFKIALDDRNWKKTLTQPNSFQINY